MSNITFVQGESKIKWITFSDRTETCKIELGEGYPTHFEEHLQCRVENGTRDIIRVGLVKDALSRLGINDVSLTLDYFPQARADRVFEQGNPLPVKVFADILNSYGFKKVYICDPHSDVTPALIDNVEVISQTDLLKSKLPEIKRYLGEDFTLVAPDLGSTKKIFDTVQALGHKGYIQAIKVRDVTTGDIVKCDLLEESVSGNVLIVDDLCDGAASFKFLAQKLKERGADKVGLYVTHAIFSKGIEVLEKDVDFIWCSGIVGNYIKREDLWRFNER